MTGVFAISAPVAADGVALVEVGMAVTLLVGMFVVRSGRVRLHAYLQSSIVLGNLPVILIWMLPRYVALILPGLPAELLQPFYLVPTLMLVVGAAAEGLGVYILLVAATNLLPERWRFRSYKRWMRTELCLWWTVVVLGLVTYLVWYAGLAPAS